MKPTIYYKGKKYAGEEAMPPDVRREYQQAAYQDDPELAELAELEREVEAEGGTPPSGAPGEHRLELLPATCPNCGGPLHGKEVKWTGPQSADCPYCGVNLPMKTP